MKILKECKFKPRVYKFDTQKQTYVEVRDTSCIYLGEGCKLQLTILGVDLGLFFNFEEFQKNIVVTYLADCARYNAFEKFAQVHFLMLEHHFNQARNTDKLSSLKLIYIKV